VAKPICRLWTVFLWFALAVGPACSPTTVAAQPREVFIIRHAEKPEDDNDVHLTAMGRERADALDQLFKKTDLRPDPLPKPDFLFAARNSKHSHRSVETLTPLAKKLKLDIDSRFENEDFAKLAKELLSNPRYAKKTVLICWHHGNIPELAQALKATDVPDKWKDPVFDRVWTIAYGAGGKVTFAKRHQALLASDDKE
jgi:phosphohistidine phosphatase SixA